MQINPARRTLAAQSTTGASRLCRKRCHSGSPPPAPPSQPGGSATPAAACPAPIRSESACPLLTRATRSCRGHVPLIASTSPRASIGCCKPVCMERASRRRAAEAT
eukprot:scaffold13094_cov70-Phaeocystis_antarctica.AAC.10